MEAYEKACQYVRFQGPPHIGANKKRKRGDPRVRDQPSLERTEFCPWWWGLQVTEVNIFYLG